jgi:hypothetical protein
MTNQSELLQYKDKHFGKYVMTKPKHFFEIKNFNFNWWESSCLRGGGAQKGAFPFSYPVDLYSANSDSFFEIYSPANKKGWVDKRLKKLSVIKHDSFELKHNLTGITKTILELVCLFPPDFIVPAGCRCLKYYGLPEWFEPFMDPEAEAKMFLKRAAEKVLGFKH